MLADNYQERIREQIKPQCTDIAVPIHIRSNSKKTYGMFDLFLTFFYHSKPKNQFGPLSLEPLNPFMIT